MSIHSDFQNIEKFHNYGWQLPTKKSEDINLILTRINSINFLKDKISKNSIPKLNSISYNFISIVRFFGFKRFDKSDLTTNSEKELFDEIKNMVSDVKQLKDHVKFHENQYKNNSNMSNELQETIAKLSEAIQSLNEVKNSLTRTKIELCLEDSIDIGTTLTDLYKSVEEIANESFKSESKDLSVDEEIAINDAIKFNLPKKSFSDLKYLVKGSSILEKNSAILEKQKDLNDLRDLLFTIKLQAGIEKVKKICNEKQSSYIDDLVKKNNINSENCDYLKLIQLVDQELSIPEENNLNKAKNDLAKSNLNALRKLNKSINSIESPEIKQNCINRLRLIMEESSRKTRREKLQEILTKISNDPKKSIEEILTA